MPLHQLAAPRQVLVCILPHQLALPLPLLVVFLRVPEVIPPHRQVPLHPLAVLLLLLDHLLKRRQAVLLLLLVVHPTLEVSARLLQIKNNSDNC